MRPLVPRAALLAIVAAGQALLAQVPAGDDTDRKVDALLARMTLEEKVGQMNQHSRTFDLTGRAPVAGDERARNDHLARFVLRPLDAGDQSPPHIAKRVRWR